MEDQQFDAWTRRRFGLAAGGLAAVFGPLRQERGTARTRKKCKKVGCRTLGQTCEPNSREQSCCQGLNCDPVEAQGTLLLCCLGRRQRCQTSAQCCGKTICFPIAGLSDPRCCGGGGQFCTSDVDCCNGYDCVTNECQAQSDRARKANFASVDAADVLHRVRQLPIATWNDPRDHAAVRHIGPTARDFHAAFGVGADTQHIHPIDGQGVALAAIQGLVVAVARLRDEHGELAARVDAIASKQRTDPRSAIGRKGLDEGANALGT